MSESISAFDGNYVRLGQVAALLAQERAQCAADDVMDLFKRVLLAGPFTLSRRGARSHHSP